MKNQEISGIFREISDILEIKGENVFRIRAYERAAQNIESLGEDIAVLFRDGRLSEIPGVGKDLSQRIAEYLDTGKIAFFEELKKSLPEGLLELLKIPSVGPKTAKLLHQELNIKSISDLESAISSGKLIGIPGIKEKTVENILHGISLVKRGRERMTLAQARTLAEEVVFQLKKLPEVKKLTFAGSLRRCKDTVRDIDILAISTKPEKVMDYFVSLPMVAEVISKGPTKASVRTKDDIQIDCRVLEERSFGAALVYFTGSKNFNIKIRKLAIKKELKVNEYGVFKQEKFICGRTEEEVFKSLGMDYVEPELREDNGEVELALVAKLPRLVSLKDIKGDLHAHSTWSDGNNSILEMGQAALARGYSYLAITDHSQSLKIARGLSEKELTRKKLEIDKLNNKLKGIRLLFGTEADIDSQGNMDYPDRILKNFDIVIAAIHTGFKHSKEQITMRLLKACNNKYVNIIAHPTGRLWGEREGYEIDFERFFQAAQETNTALEINSYPQRLDLNDQLCRQAKEKGVKLAINTDSHLAAQLQAMDLGVSVARRGWLAKEDVINTLPLDKLLKEIKK